MGTGVSDHPSTATLADVARRLGTARRVAVCTHRKPDGDALGSMLGLSRALRARGATVDLLVIGPIEPGLARFLEGTSHRRADDAPPSGGPEPDAIVVLDTCAWSQLEPLEPWLRARGDRVLVVDHHPHGDDVGAVRFVDPTASATAQLVVALLDAMGGPITGGPDGVAEALYLGIATDTGWFRYANTSGAVLRAAARLLDAGVDHARVYSIIEEGHRPQRLALVARSLESIEYAAGGAVAIQTLRLADFAETRGEVTDLEGVVNMPMAVRDVRVSILLTEIGPALTKMSLRAKPAASGAPALDVNAFARCFGGGGHTFAAGARVEAGAEETKCRLMTALAGVSIAS